MAERGQKLSQCLFELVTLHFNYQYNATYTHKYIQYVQLYVWKCCKEKSNNTFSQHDRFSWNLLLLHSAWYKYFLDSFSYSYYSSIPLVFSHFAKLKKMKKKMDAMQPQHIGLLCETTVERRTCTRTAFDSMFLWKNIFWRNLTADFCWHPSNKKCGNIRFTLAKLTSVLPQAEAGRKTKGKLKIVQFATSIYSFLCASLVYVYSIWSQCIFSTFEWESC